MAARNGADGRWTYLIETVLLVKGRAEPFGHRDANTLQLREAAKLNPLAVIVNDRAKST